MPGAKNLALSLKFIPTFRSHSLVNGQVLPCDYTLEETRIVMHEMIDASILELVQKGLVAESISLSIGYARPKITAKTKSSFPQESPSHRHFYAHTGGTRKIDRRTNLREC